MTMGDSDVNVNIYSLNILSICHHLASIVRCKLFLSSSSLKPLGQFEPNFARMVLEWPPFKIVCDSLILLVKGLTRGPKREINYL
jgi:hypothetical protein